MIPERDTSPFWPDRGISDDKHFSQVIAELKSRTHHKDKGAASIADSLLSVAGGKSWVSEALHASESKKYSPMELAILLEKVVILHLIDNLWELAANSDPIFPAVLAETQEKLTGVNWNQVVANDIPDHKWQEIIGKRSLQTHLLERYKGVISQVVKPVISENNQTPLTFVDAGASGGLGAWAASEEGLNVKSWLALDYLKPDIPWILTCSVRLSQISSGQYQDYLEKITKPPSSLERIVADMEAIPIKDNSADIYLSIFSWYQRKGFKRTLKEAKRVVRPAGLIVVTDNLLWKDGQLSFVSPGQNGQLTTIIWTLDQNRKLHGPFKCMTWKSSDCTEGNIGKGLQEVQEIVRGFRS